MTQPARHSRSLRHTFAGLAVLAAGGTAAALGTTASAAPAAPTFGTPVVVDHWRPGAEPDAAIDNHDSTGNRFYTSSIFGFSTTMSFVYRTEDHGKTFHLVEGNVAGKPTTCIGGGDSELQVNKVDGQVFLGDLQGLTNFSNSTSKDGGRNWNTTCVAVPLPGVDRQWIAIDNNGGKSKVGGGAGDARVYYTYDNIFQSTESRDTTSGAGGNELVMNASKDGVNYGGGTGCVTTGINCVLPPAVISGDEGLPGNTLVDNTPGGKYQHSVYVLHTNGAGSGVILSYCRGPKTGKKTAATVSNDCTDPSKFDPTDSGHVSTEWHDVAVRKADPNVNVEAFTVIAMDRKGGLYATWAEYPSSNGSFAGTGRVMLTHSTDGGAHWSSPRRVNPTGLPTPVQPWISAGDPGRVDIAYYAAPEAKEAGKFGPDNLTQTGTWNLYLDQSLNARSSAPTFAHVKVSDHQMKFGNVSTQGLGGSPDRSLGDFMQVQTGVHGEAVLSYVDDTSANRNPDFTFGSGQSPAEAAGPVMSAVQTGGPSLYTHVGAIHGGNRRPYGTVSDPTGKGYPDAFLSQLGSDTKAPSSLDIGRVTMTQSDSKHLRITMKTADKHLASDLSIPVTLGGTTADWLVRWATPSYHKPNGHGGYLGDGTINYAGMESTSGGTPTFFTGSTDSLNTTHAKFFIYAPQHAIPGSIHGGTITWTVPLKDVGNPPKGAGLYSVTGFTSTQLLQSTNAITTLLNGGSVSIFTPPNLIDQAVPLSYTIGKLTPHVPGSTEPPTQSGGGSGSGSGGGSAGGTTASTGLSIGIPIAGLVLVVLALVVARRRRHVG